MNRPRIRTAGRGGRRTLLVGVGALVAVAILLPGCRTTGAAPDAPAGESPAPAAQPEAPEADRPRDGADQDATDPREPRAAPQEASVVQAGAPGEPSRILSRDEMRRVERPAHTEADVRFMQDMIVHHAQALDLAELVHDRTERADIRLLARRIEVSQDSEIALMTRWLEERGEEAPDPAEYRRGHGGHGGHAGHEHPHAHEHAHDPAHPQHPPAHDEPPAHPRHPPAHHDPPAHDESKRAAAHAHMASMPGMLTEAQMAALEAASGTGFDRLFLEYMIHHHEGALTMVRELFRSPGAAQGGEIFEFASHVDSDQRIEIERMSRMLGASP